jgi:hypothetical protein
LSRIGYLFNFRNRSHRVWFFFSIALLLLIVCANILYPDSMGKVLTIVGAVLHGWITFVAFLIWVLKAQNESFSRDCIWFNGILWVIYVTLL